MGCLLYTALECRTVKERSGIDEGDIAKRLMDFGYHAPTPVSYTHLDVYKRQEEGFRKQYHV